jgi:hypothetical protein
LFSGSKLITIEIRLLPRFPLSSSFKLVMALLANTGKSEFNGALIAYNRIGLVVLAKKFPIFAVISTVFVS